MGNFGIKYASMLGGMMLLFVNFVACGAQMYQVSMKDDHGSRLATGPSPESTDPASPTFGLHAPNGWKQLPIRFVVGQDLTPAQQRGLMRAMNTWEIAVGKKLFDFVGIQDGVTGDSFSDLYSSLDDDINGHYLDDHWDKTGKPQVVLATTIWDNWANDLKAIKTADIRFNSNYYLIGDALKLKARDSLEVVDMQTLALHELGHLLGLAHVNATIDSESIMTPSLYIGEGLTNRRLSRGDVMRAQKIYGCAGPACDVDKTLARIDKLMRQSIEEDEKAGKAKSKNSKSLAASYVDPDQESGAVAYPDFRALLNQVDTETDTAH